MSEVYADSHVMLYRGDAFEVLRSLEAGSIQCVVTSPPFWGLRDYNVAGQLGLEATPEEYVAKLVEIFRAVRRVLAANRLRQGVLDFTGSANGSSSTPAREVEQVSLL